jgi:hypothetical protein
MRDILMRYSSQINSGVVKVVLILSAGIDAGVDAAQNCGRGNELHSLNYLEVE